MTQKQYKIDWEKVEKSWEAKNIYKKSELQIKKENKNKNNNKIAIVSMKSVYLIKNFDSSKKRFANDTLISKNYEKVLESNLKEWSKLFKIKIEI